MARLRIPVLPVALVSLMAVLFSGCIQGSQSGSQGAAASSECVSAGQSGVSNQPGHFSMGKQVASTCSDSETYKWQNAGTRAQVMYGGQLSKGSLMVKLQDSSGKQVFTKTFEAASQSGGQSSSSTGLPGEWKITITADGVVGQLGLTITTS